MAFDSTPTDLATPDGPGDGAGPERRRIRPRTLLLIAVVAIALIGTFVATGAADAAQHWIAHTFPMLSPDGCGGG